MKEGSIKKQPVSENQDKGKGAQQWLACGGRGKINLIVRTDSHFEDSVAQERWKSSTGAKGKMQRLS